MIILKERVLFPPSLGLVGFGFSYERKVDLKPFRRRECFRADARLSTLLNHPGELRTERWRHELWFEGILRSQ